MYLTTVLLFTKSTFLSLVNIYFKDGTDFYTKISSKTAIDYAKISPISVDKAILEKAKELEVTILDYDFQDIVSFLDFDGILTHSDADNVIQPDSEKIKKLTTFISNFGYGIKMKDEEVRKRLFLFLRIQ